MAQRPSKGLADVVAAARSRREDLPEPDPELSVAANFLLQATGVRPAQRAAEILDTCLLHPDHTMNAATLSDMQSAVVTALGIAGRSRWPGWTAHVIEQHADNRLIRPDSEYIGEGGLSWVPLAAR